MIRLIATACLGLICAAPVSAASPCGTSTTNGKTTVVIAPADDALYFRVTDLALDHDGSPRAYGVRDQGLENICDGLAPLNPPACRGRISGDCFKACQSAFAAWSAAGSDPASLGKWMCSVGLGGDNCAVPKARLQAAPQQDWFVSETAVHVADPNGLYPPGWVASQSAQLDPAVVPYLVIPGSLRATSPVDWDATPGDAGVIIDAKSNRTVPFVIGDTGPALGEASTKVHADLSDGALPRKGTRTSALGQPVESYLAGSSGDFRVAIFRHTSQHRPGASTQLALTADALVPWIEKTAQAKLGAIGGAARVLACTGGPAGK